MSSMDFVSRTRGCNCRVRAIYLNSLSPIRVLKADTHHTTVIHLVEDMLQREPTYRPTARQILRHEWLH